VAVAGQQYTPETLAAIADPEALLELAWELEPWGRYTERDAVLDRLEQLLVAGRVPPPPPRSTERLLREAQRDSAHEDWFQTHIGVSFLLEATELLDRVGLTDEATVYLERARARAGDEDEEVMQARAVLLARSGDPWLALEQLQALARGDWLEKRTSWRHTLLTAWAMFRAGRDGAGAVAVAVAVAARAFAHAAARGGVRVAQAGEPELTAALAPLAEAAGSPHARKLLTD
jgi:hypothetical protein